MVGESDRFVIQGVHMLMEGDFMGPWPEGAARRSRLVFIGRGLDGMGLEEGFAACRAG
jgi:G3E family GTPase